MTKCVGTTLSPMGTESFPCKGYVQRRQIRCTRCRGLAASAKQVLPKSASPRVRKSGFVLELQRGKYRAKAKPHYYGFVFATSDAAWKFMHASSALFRSYRSMSVTSVREYPTIINSEVMNVRS